MRNVLPHDLIYYVLGKYIVYYCVIVWVCVYQKQTRMVLK